MSDDEIMLSNPSVSLTAIPEPAGMTLTCEGRTYRMDRSGTTWTTMLQGITEGNHIIDVKPDGANSISIPIKIVGVNINEDINEMFDL